MFTALILNLVLISWSGVNVFFFFDNTIVSVFARTLRLEKD